MIKHTKSGTKNNNLSFPRKRESSKYSFLSLAFLTLAVLFFVFNTNFFVKQELAKINNPQQTLLWKYQCIDTMKTSRDKARIWKQQPNLHADINTQLTKIKETGANCVAIDTPYDKEFLPYLRLWVTSARTHGLSIWFRGNFSSWEGWFDYPKGMTSEELLKNSKQFILDNPDLFQDGDIFTAAPEAENGGEFNQVEIDEHEAYRKFLIDEYQLLTNTFKSINKKVDVRWLSMNGGLAKRMFDDSTINALDKTVAIDHYIKTPQEMGEFINYFSNNFNAKVIIGEFGAPIPEINGPMNEDQQAEFTEKLFQELYKHREKVIGINYWVLYDSSTAILNEDGSEKKVFNVIKKYFSPRIIQGKIINNSQKPLSGIIISEASEGVLNKTDSQGKYRIILPARPITLRFSDKGFKTKIIEFNSTENINNTITMEKISISWMEKIELWLRQLLRQ